MTKLQRLERRMQTDQFQVGPAGAEGDAGVPGPAASPVPAQTVTIDVTGTKPAPSGTAEPGSLWLNGNGSTGMVDFQVWVMVGSTWTLVIQGV